MAVSVAVCEIFSVKKWCDLENMVRVHSRSLEMAPFDRSYTSSSSPSIITMAISRNTSSFRYSANITWTTTTTLLDHHHIMWLLYYIYLYIHVKYMLFIAIHFEHTRLWTPYYFSTGYEHRVHPKSVVNTERLLNEHETNSHCNWIELITYNLELLECYISFIYHTLFNLQRIPTHDIPPIWHYSLLNC